MRARMAIKLCDIKCEIREVRLNNKPDQMIKQSPKGTVPVLVLKNKVIDESNEIIDCEINKLDISILPFIRQFRIADVEWFDSQNKIKNIKNIILNFLDSELFKDVMNKYDVWEENTKPVFFP